MKRLLVKTPFIGRIALLIIRFFTGMSFFKAQLKNFTKWLVTSRETTNFTYNLTPSNTRYLIHYLSVITNKNSLEIETYINEIENDATLKLHIQSRQKTSTENFKADFEPRYGRRIGWYAIVRAMKPIVVVETGVDKGLGSCVITSALMKNKQEGFEGRYYGTDINPKAGYLLSEPYLEFGKILIGDSIESLQKLNESSIDIFINDSDHSDLYEEREYQIIQSKLHSKSIVLGDNSHCTTKLEEFATITQRKFLFFKEEPLNHWYPGAGIGAAYNS